jgi:NhaP-type Na+/H+ or K+/H+ antiporter
MVPLIIFLTLLFVYSLVSRRVEASVLTAPMLFTAAGMLLYPVLPAIRSAGVNATVLLRVAEIGLVLLLFTDASRTDFGVLRNIKTLPARLLSVGMLLTILLGAVAAKLVFPWLSLWEAGILAAILAPTDAGLGQVIVNSPRVPMRLRQALNVEAGLNDGLSVPFMLFFMAIAAAKVEGESASLTQFAVEQLGFGVLVGLGVGLIGGWLLGLARRKGWAADSFLQVGVVAVPLIGMGISELVAASMFIAAFVAGLAVQPGFEEASKHSVEFTEEWGQLFNLAVFFLFGMIVVKYWSQFDARCWFYAVLSLTIVRMLPVAISLTGARTGDEPARRVDHPAGRDFDGCAEHLRPWFNRTARDWLVRAQHSAAVSECPGKTGCRIGKCPAEKPDSFGRDAGCVVCSNRGESHEIRPHTHRRTPSRAGGDAGGGGGLHRLHHLPDQGTARSAEQYHRSQP